MSIINKDNNILCKICRLEKEDIHHKDKNLFAYHKFIKN